MKLIAKAGRPYSDCIKLQAGRYYDVLEVLEERGNRLFLVVDETGNQTAYNMHHFTDSEIVL